MGESFFVLQDTEIKQFVDLHVKEYMTQCIEMLPITQPNFLPVTFTLWRKVALSNLDILNDVNKMHQFSKSVDIDLLEQFRSQVSDRYRTAILEDDAHCNIDKMFPQYRELFSSKQFQKLVNTLAEWLTLIELCDDFLTRLVDYGLADKQSLHSLQVKLAAAWTVFKKEKIQKRPVIHFFDELVKQFMHHAEVVGIVGYLEHEA